MIEFFPLQASHLAGLQIQAAQSFMQAELSVRLDQPEFVAQLSLGGMAHAGVIGDQVAACAGIIPLWPGRAQAWALIAEVPRAVWPSLHKRVLVELDIAVARGFRRVETSVKVGFLPGIKWARMLGFTVEGMMLKYDPMGHDHFLMARVR